MKCTDIVEIIKACGDNGVTSIAIGDMSIEFGNRYIDTSCTPSPYIDSITPTEYNEEDEEDESMTEDEQASAIDELKFTDPELWDELARNGEV